MIYLFLTVFFTVALFLIFRAFPALKINTFNAIVINYSTCFLLSFIFLRLPEIKSAFDSDKTWVILCYLTGISFILTFNLIAYTVQKVNVTVATIANKMSLIIPVTASIFILNIDNQSFSFLNYTGIILGIVAIILTSINPGKSSGYISASASSHSKTFYVVLPVTVFILGGLIDLSINYINLQFLSDKNPTLFSLVAFFAAASTGIVILTYRLITKRTTLSVRDTIGGFILGIPNYFSIVFLLKTLSYFNNNGAVVFPTMNIAVILLSAFLAYLIFKDKLSKVNIAGMLIAIIAIYLVFLKQA
ncbi:MAG: hypothetical protein ACK40G_07920 [Cytophagaceae bacterium]